MPSSSTETSVRSFGFRRACLRLRSHAAFLRTTRPPFTSVRGLPSFGSNTLTSAGSAARNSQKSGTPLYLNAASRTAFAVSGRRVLAICEGRSEAADSEDDDSGYGKGAGVGNTDDSEMVGTGTCTGVSYGYGPGTLMVGTAGSIFPIGKPNMIISPPAIPIIPISRVAWSLSIVE